MSEVWKYPMNLGPTGVDMPRGAVPLCVQMQRGTPTLWALVAPNAPATHRLFVCFGTGHEVPEGVIYIDTVQQPPFVWHFFEVPE